MTATAKQFLAALASQVGYREGRDPNGNWNNDNKFGRWYGMNHVAWCAIFQSWAADQVGALGTLVPKYASCTAGLNWFRAKGQTGVWPPRPGDIFILCEYAPGRWNALSNGWAPIHTGAVERWVPDTAAQDGGFIVTIEGNTNLGGSAQGNGVYRLQRRDSRNNNAIIYCRPNWALESAPKPPVQTGGDSAPIHVPGPPAKSSPAKGQTSTANIAVTLNKPIHMSSLQQGKRGTDVSRYQAALWNRLPGAVRQEFISRYGLRRTDLYDGIYGKVTAAMTSRLYRLIRLPAATEPGPKMMRHLGFTDVRK